MTLQANLTNRDATRCRTRSSSGATSRRAPQDVPPALARAVHLAALPPRGPGVRLDPDGRLGRRGRRRRRRATRPSARSAAAPSPTPAASRDARRAARAPPANPVLVAGPDIDASGGWDAAVALAERQRLPVWATPAAGRRAARLPRGPPELPGHPAAGDRAARRDARGPRPGARRRRARSSPTTRTSPARCCPRAPRSCRSPAIPTRRPARRWATRSSPTSALTLEALLAAGPASPIAPRPSRVRAPEPAAGVRTRSAPRRCTRRSREVFPRTGSSCSSRRRARWRCATSCGSRGPAATTSAPAAASASASPAAVGVQLAQPDRPVVCVIGEGSAQYAITALWTAVAYDVPVTFLVLRNEEYAILKWFAELEEVAGAPGPRPARARHRRRRARLRRAVARASDGRDELRAALARRSPRTRPSWSRSRSRRAWPCSGAELRCRCSSPTSSGSRPGGRARARPRARRARRGHARAAARRPRGAARRRPRAVARDRPGPLRLGREPLPAVPAGGRDGPRRRRRRGDARLRAAHRHRR